MNRYEFEAICLCPNGQLQDRYDCVIESRGIIQAERIVEWVKRIANEKLYQEDLADDLRNTFQAKVKIVGDHFGITITCTRE
jgi:hypothetical protein